MLEEGTFALDREFGDRGALWEPSKHPRGRQGRFIDVLRSLRSQPRAGIDGVVLPSGHTVTFKRGAYRVHDRGGKVVAHGVTPEEVRVKLAKARIPADVGTPRLRVDSSRVLAKASPGTTEVPGTRMRVTPPTDRPGPGYVWQPGTRFVGPDGREGHVVSARFAFRPSVGPPADAAYKVRYAEFYTGVRGGFGELKSSEMRFHPDDVAAKQGEYEKLVEKIGKLPKRTPASTAKLPSQVALGSLRIPHAWAVEHGYTPPTSRPPHSGDHSVASLAGVVDPEEIAYHFLTGRKSPYITGRTAQQFSYKGGKNKADREAIIRKLTEAVCLLHLATDNAAILRARALVAYCESSLAEVQHRG